MRIAKAVRVPLDMIVFLLLSAAAAVSLGLTWVLLRYALTHRLVDVPNERSSHRRPTPRGGGMAIAVAFLGSVLALWALGLLPSRLGAAVGGSGSLVAVVGFLDDHGHVSRRWRLFAHFVAATWALFCLNGMPALTVASGLHLPRGWLSNGIAAVYFVWLVNLFNFMDGIDGIASVETITACLGGILLYLIVVPGNQQWIVPAVLLASAGGFLFWNFPPARIFMGDAGSGFLGITLAVLSVQAAWAAPNLFWAWVILLGVFIVDASVTLIRRVLKGGRIYLEPHRSHAYQYVAWRLGTHAPVTVAVGLINLVWLCPLAVCVGLGYLNGVLGLLIAYIPLIGLALRLRAGADPL
jgi:Fuc2NAc and GlcNAc transferase